MRMNANSVGEGSVPVLVADDGRAIPNPRAPSTGDAKLTRPPAIPRSPREADRIGRVDRTVEMFKPRMLVGPLAAEIDIFTVVI